ncbi:MAG: leucine-rich repeat domain-containing protein [Tannerellaceae bacterium]|jgi:hypothetical protein|nr:leucine-rich repeat domain-containing protein [Tannerellaceae bacterium]
MKKAVFLVLFMLSATSLSAFEIAGLKYEVTAGQAWLVGVEVEELSVYVDVPTKVEFAGIPYEVIGIKENAFRDNIYLKAIRLAASIRTIGLRAFEGCTALERIELLSLIPPSAEKGFENAGWIDFFSGVDTEKCVLVLRPYIAHISSLESLYTVHPLWSGFSRREYTMQVTEEDNYPGPGEEGLFDFSFAASDGLFYIRRDMGAGTATLVQGTQPLSYPVSVLHVPDSVFEVSDVGIRIFYKVTAIGDSALRFSDMDTLVLPTGVRTIGASAFFNCDKLKKVTFPNDLEEIGVSAFEGCFALSIDTFKVGEKLHSIRNRAFQEVWVSEISFADAERLEYLSGFGRTKLKSLNDIPETVKTIGDGAFSGCKIKSVTLPSKLKYLSGFEETDIESLHIPEGVEELGLRAFADCPITKLTLPASVRKIGAEALSIKLLDTLRSESKDVPMANALAFKEVDKTTCILEIPVGTSYRARTGWEDFLLVEEFGDPEPPVVPEEPPVDLPVVHFEADNGQGVFMPFKILTTEEVELVAFSDPLLAPVNYKGEVLIPSRVTWEDAPLEPTIYRVKSVGKGAFRGCTNLTGLSIEGGVEYVDTAFGGCTGLEKVVLLEGDKPLNGRAKAFAGTTVKEVRLLRDMDPSSNLFYEAVEVERLFIGEKVSVIGATAFVGCSHLRNVEIAPTTATLHFASALALASSPLAKVYIGRPLSFDAGSPFRDKPELTNIEFGPDVTSLPEWLFLNNTRLYRLTIPKNVKTIERGAFQGCSMLSEVTLGASVQEIRGEAFSGCTNLTRIICLNAHPADISTLTFEGIDKETCELIVPYGAEPAYKSAMIWNEFLRLTSVEENGDAVLYPLATGSTDVVDVYTLGGRFVGHYPDGIPSVLPKGAYIVRGIQGVSKVVR